MSARRLWTAVLFLRQFTGRACRGLLTPSPVQTQAFWCTASAAPAQMWALYPMSSFPRTGVTAQSSSVVPIRCKSSKNARKVSKKKSQIGREAEEDDEDPDPEISEDEDEPEDNTEDDLGLPRNYKDQERVLQSLRYDIVIRAGLDMPRNKIDDAFYANKLRLNGQPLIKKSKTVSVGDTLDLVIKDDGDSGTMTLMRVIFKAVASGTEDSEKYKVVLRRWKHLTLPTQ